MRPEKHNDIAGDAASKPAKPSATGWQILVTVLGAGGAVMVVEILGTRVIGPVFGVSLFVWAALLTVTLASLAVGYYTGGVLGDRWPEPRLLGTVVTGAGALLGLVPIVSHAILGATQSLGPRVGPLVSTVVLFAPSLTVLGMTGPIAVRLATRDLGATGHSVGRIYAVSTAGSLVGTVATAFVLVPAFETRQILLGTSVFLVLLGCVGLVLRGRRAAVVALLVPVIAAILPRDAGPPNIVVVDRAESPYGLIEVLDDLDRGVRFLRADHSVIGAQYKQDRSPGFAFLHQLEAVRFLRPSAKHLLQIGLGIGSLPMALAPWGFTADVVEIDPAVVRFAKADFGFSTAGQVHVEDARTFVARTDQRYDIIVHDTFTGGSTPEHLLSVEVVRRLQEILEPGGVLALNFAGYQGGPKARASEAVARTIRSVFKNVRIFRDSDPADHPEDVSNMLFFASDAPLDFTIPPGARFESPVCEETLRSLEQWEVLRDVLPGPIVTDELNPLTRLQLPVAEDHFEAMNRLLPAEVWLR